MSVTHADDYFIFYIYFSRGFTAIINDNLMANVFQLTVVILTIFSGLFGYFVAYVWTCDGEENSTFLMSLTFFGLLSGCVVGLALSSMLNSATSAVFVAFAEDPHVLKVLLSSLNLFVIIIVCCTSFQGQSF